MDITGNRHRQLQMNPPPPLSHYNQPPPPSPQLAPPPPNLSATLSALSSLLSHSQTTLNSLSPFLPPPSPSPLIPCPFNPTHSLPHSSLFSHYLSCPSSFAPLSDLTFSQNFFYSDCPGAVTAGSENSNGPELTLPELLSAECADNNGFELRDFAPEVGITPSEIWAVRSEIEGWVGYPSSYSCRLLRSVLSTCTRDFQCLLTWVIENSLKYGVVIDLGMRDHIVLLFKLCLKAILREAVSLFKGIRGEETFDCPVLMTVMSWLGSQLSTLYGEASGNSFAITMLKEFVLESALHSSYFPVIEKAKEHGDPEGAPGESGVQKSVIVVNQVAAAVAALYERSWLEDKITKLRGAAHLTTYQRFLEHENISNGAHVERQKRSNYRPIIDHDGVLSKRSHNQEPNRIKTPAELLAEERDYKRRRMSYRGKKMKRTTVQVMRDIIDVFMEEIQRAGGLGSVKEAEGTEATGFGSSSVHSVTSDVHDPTKQLSPYVHLSKDAERSYGEHYEKRNDDSRYHGNADNARSSIRERHDRKGNSRNNDRRKTDWPIHEHTRHREYSEGNGENVYHGSGSSLRKKNESEQKNHRSGDGRPDSDLSHNHATKKRDRRSDLVQSESEDGFYPSKGQYNHEYSA